MRKAPLTFVLLLCGCPTNFDEKESGTPTPDAGGDAGDAGGENLPPIAVDDAAEARTEEAVEIRVTDNDSDPEGAPLIVSEIVQPENGIVEILAGEFRVEYTSLADFVGIDSFEYTVSDQAGGTDTATVTVNVTEVPVLTLVITEPEDGATVEGPDIRISFEVTGCTVSRPAADAEGCHVHKFLDSEQYTDADGEGFGHYSAASFTISPIPDGEHEFTLELIANDGSDGPVDPYVSDSVTFEVGVAAGDSDSDTDADTDADTDTDSDTDSATG